MLLFLESGGQMTVGFVFWLLMLLWAIFGVVWFRKEASPSYIIAGGNVLIFILLFLLGWAQFGWPIVGKN